jgi:predicted nuclease with TOPRIM domain
LGDNGGLMMAKLPWKWIIIVAVILAAVLYVYYSGKSAGDWKAKFEQIKSEEAKATKEKDAWIKACEDEIRADQAKIDQIENEKAGLRVKAAQSDAKIAQRDQVIDDLKKKLKEITVSSDPDIIISDLNKRGLSSIRRK